MESRFKKDFGSDQNLSYIKILSYFKHPEFELLSNLGIKNVIEFSQGKIKIPMIAILVNKI